MGVQEQEWRDSIEKYPIKSCGRLDMQTSMPSEVTVGRVTSDRVRYVYFEDGSEVICLGKLCDYVAFKAADYTRVVAEKDARIAELEEACRAVAFRCSIEVPNSRTVFTPRQWVAVVLCLRAMDLITPRAESEANQ